MKRTIAALALAATLALPAFSQSTVFGPKNDDRRSYPTDRRDGDRDDRWQDRDRDRDRDGDRDRDRDRYEDRDRDRDRDGDHDRDDRHDRGKHRGWYKGRGHDRDDRYDRDDRGRYMNPGFRTGYQEGRLDGSRDAQARRRFGFGPGYKHPDRGYQNQFGDRNQYKAQYRSGYEQGYNDGYYNRGSRYGSGPMGWRW